ncbi:hypothetical protein [Thermococcus sp.]|uniref:hypothetical protein n=1 Tax=Thermococcus sp. TaxID=35749 RepID=UPI002625FC45|nr:hypothetical protein [Thermococcus sp.]
MFKQDQIEKGVGISHELIEAMSQKIHSAGFEFIWIPSVPTMNIEGTNIFPWYYPPNYPEPVNILTMFLHSQIIIWAG